MYTEVTWQDDWVDFTIYNKNTFWSSITKIYIDLGSLADDFPPVTITDGPGTNFSEYPHWYKSSWRWYGNNKAGYDVTLGATCPTFKNGINPGEWVKISFELPENVTISDVIDEINSGDLRIGAGVTGMYFGPKELSLVVTPDPATFTLLGLGAFGLLRRRRT
jgi:MYXO-CTERM domain-containing protein